MNLTVRLTGLLVNCPELVQLDIFIQTEPSIVDTTARFRAWLQQVGLASIGVFASSPLLAFAALILGVTGVLSEFAPFWQIPTTLLASTAAAGGIALLRWKRDQTPVQKFNASFRFLR